MELGFTNRVKELKELNLLHKKGGLIVLYGRRRVGKSRLIQEWFKKKKNALYSQAIEGHPELQLGQIFADLKQALNTSITPKSWAELFEIIEYQKEHIILCIDEFPYLVQSDSSVPSIFQKWIDTAKKKNMTLILCGSSNKMMNDIFLDGKAPLYGRAQKIINLEPMSYKEFAKALKLNPKDQASFEHFSLVGGVPKYWEFIDTNLNPVKQATELYFDFAPYMQHEPRRMLRDEGLTGLNPLSVLEAIGRGSERSSEIASRLGMPQTNLSRVFFQLIDTGILERVFPFSESARSSKKSIYKILDPTLRFWYRVYSPHRTRWNSYSTVEKQKLIRDHAASVYEDYWRKKYPDSQKYWESNIEFDMLRKVSGSKKGVILSEIKWKTLSPSAKNRLEKDLLKKWESCLLSKKYTLEAVEIIDDSKL